MKLPDIFTPEHKSLEEKTEQLLEKAKIVKEVAINQKKESMLQEIKSYLDLPPDQQRPIRLQILLDELLSKEGYTHLTTKSPIPLWEYWTKETDYNQTKLFFRSRETNHLYDTYGYALLCKENVNEFCNRLEKYKTEEESKRNHSHYDFSTCMSSGLGSAIAYSGVMAGIELCLSKEIHFVIYAAGILLSYWLGGAFFDSYAHKRKKKKLTKLCSYFTENEKEALRLALD